MLCPLWQQPVVLRVAAGLPPPNVFADPFLPRTASLPRPYLQTPALDNRGPGLPWPLACCLHAGGSMEDTITHASAACPAPRRTHDGILPLIWIAGRRPQVGRGVWLRLARGPAFDFGLAQSGH